MAGGEAAKQRYVHSNGPKTGEFRITEQRERPNWRSVSVKLFLSSGPRNRLHARAKTPSDGMVSVKNTLSLLFNLQKDNFTVET